MARRWHGNLASRFDYKSLCLITGLQCPRKGQWGVLVLNTIHFMGINRKLSIFWKMGKGPLGSEACVTVKTTVRFLNYAPHVYL